MRRLTQRLGLVILLVLLTASGTLAADSEGSPSSPEQAIEDLIHDAETARSDIQDEIIAVAAVLQDDDVVLFETEAGILPLDLQRMHELIPIMQLILTAAPELEDTLLERFPSVRALLGGASLFSELFGGDDVTIATLDPDVLEAALRSRLGKKEQQLQLVEQRITQLEVELEDMQGLIDGLEEVRAELMAQSRDATGFAGVWSWEGDRLRLDALGGIVNGEYGYDDDDQTFGNGGRRVKLWETSDRKLEGFWIKDTPSARRCEQTQDGSRYWGGMTMTFDESISSYEGTWGYCDKPAIWSTWTGGRIEEP